MDTRMHFRVRVRRCEHSGLSQERWSVQRSCLRRASAQVEEILDYTYVDHWDSGAVEKVRLVRHTKQRDYVITADDAESGAGCTLLQIFCKCENHEEAAAMEMAVRDLVYLIKQDSVQPQHRCLRSLSP
jgi:hypothetical protein